MLNFIKSWLNKVNNHNNYYLEISLGKFLDIDIFDTKISLEEFQKLKKKFVSKLGSKKNFKTIKTKIYYQNNLFLYINDQFQPKCFKEILLDHKMFNNNKSYDFNVKISNKQMISVENFQTLFKYHNENFKIIESYNIQNKFFFNFVENYENKNKFYTIHILLTKKNGKIPIIINTLQNILQNYLQIPF